MGNETLEYTSRTSLKDQVLKDMENDRDKRNRYAEYLYWTVCAYLGLMFLILLLAGFKAWGFRLDTSVLVTLLGTTTANVIGLYAIVTSYFFHRRKR